MKNYFLYATLLILCFVGIQSCQKEVVRNAPETNLKFNDETIENRNQNTFSWPQNLNGRLVFKDFNGFASTYQDLDIHLANDGSGLAQRKFDNEGRANRSYDAPIETVHNLLLNDYFVNPNDRYKPFLTDPVAMQLVNEYYEFQVGDVVVTYINNSELLLAPESNSRLINQIRALPKGGDFEASELPNDAVWASLENLEVELRGICGCNITVEQTDCCSVRVFGNCKNFIGKDGDGTVRIEFRPGLTATPIVFREVVNGNFSFTFDNLCDNSVYNPDSEFEVNIWAYADTDCIFGGTKEYFWQFQQNRSCDVSENDTGWGWESNLDRGMSHRTSNYSNYFTRFEAAEVFSKRWISTTIFGITFEGWFPVDAESLKASIDARRGTLACGFDSEEDEPNDCNDCAHRLARVNTGAFDNSPTTHCIGDVVGEFELWFFDPVTVPSFNILEAIGTVQYECCQ